MDAKDIAEAEKWLKRKLYLHKAYVETFKENECPWTMRTVKHKRKQIKILTTIMKEAGFK